jgi:PAS domain S-box-containing protein
VDSLASLSQRKQGFESPRERHLLVRGCPQSPPNRYSRIVVLPLEDGLAVSFRDISKHRAFEIESERRPLKSEEHLRLAAEAAEIGTWDVDPQTGARHWSSHFRNILGLAEEVEPNTGLFSSLIHPKDRDRVNELYRLAYEGADGGRYATEFRIVRANDGAERWVATRGRGPSAKSG